MRESELFLSWRTRSPIIAVRSHSALRPTIRVRDTKSNGCTIDQDQYIVCVTHIHIALMLTICGRHHRFDSI